MNIELATAVGWLFLAIFAVLAVISILDLVKLIEIRGENRRKWLFRSVLGCVVLAVGGFGKAYFDAQKQSLPNSNPPAVSSSAAAAPKGEAAASSGPPMARATNGQQPGSAESESQAPAGLREWAEQELGPRPNFVGSIRNRYPACVATLQARDAVENSRTEARECGIAIEQFRRSEITPVLTKKSTYQVNLESFEAKTRSGGLSPDEADRREYVIAEIARMNGVEWNRFVAVDRDSYRDLGACNSPAKCTLGD